MTFTTGECARLLNIWSGCPDAYNSSFILGEVKEGLLIARVHYRGGHRQRARVRIHHDDLVAYVQQHHSDLLSTARQYFAAVAWVVV